jgi:hypothetical protein
MRCPICDDDGYTLGGLALHVEDDHPSDLPHLQVVIRSHVPLRELRGSAWPVFSAGFPGVDIDAVHRKQG